MAELKKQGVEVSVVFVGSAPKNSSYDNELKEMSSRLGIEGQVQWLGFKTNVYDDLRSAVALLAPSEKEPLGRVIFEAWDAGTVPVVWQGSGGAAEVVEASGGGIIFQERTPASLGEAMKRALDLSKEQRAALVANGRAWLADHHDPAQIASELSKIWQRCMQKGPTVRSEIE
jgi:glycosyltransferase involved in cell wall biosynthesis